MGFEITILGSSSATPTPDRFPSAQYLKFDNRLFLIDCGEGAQMQMMKYGLKFFKTEKIFISHLHPDHFLGLPGILSTLSLNGRTREIEIYCPEPLAEILSTLFAKSGSNLTFPIAYRFLEEKKSMETIFEDDSLRVRTFDVQHRVRCWGFLFDEKKFSRKIIKEKVVDQDLPHEGYETLRSAKDYIDKEGRVYKYEEFTASGERPSSYAFVTDTKYLREIAKKLKDTKVIYHEATFLHELKDKADSTFHSTAREAAMFAREAGVEKLIIGHFSSRYKDLKPLLEEARQIFPETFLAVEGEKFTF